MRKFDYVMIFTIYGKKITSQGSKSKNFLQNMVWSKDYVTGVKSLSNQTHMKNANGAVGTPLYQLWIYFG